MFSSFFYYLRAKGLDISMKEWLTLSEALELGLHDSTMTGFYQLCMAILCKSEADYDKFGQAFLEFFHDEKVFDENGEVQEHISQQMMDWVNDPGSHILRHYSEKDITEEMRNMDRTEIERRFRKVLKDQNRKHDGGNKFIGTQGISPYGNNGLNNNGIRVGGTGGKRSARRVAGERNFKDFRDDNVLDIRQFQMAFRILQRFSNQNGAEDEFDIDETINQTSKKGGILQIRYKKPRRNTIKVLLLMDSGGSMDPYSQLCSRLFQAASRSNRFKDLKVYYFHNCIEEYLYTNPTLEKEYAVSTQKILRECDKDYRVIMVGDATMEKSDLDFHPLETTRNNLGYCGLDWLQLMLRRYEHIVWLNPYSRPIGGFFGEWGETYDQIASMFDMYHLTAAGLEAAMKKLMVKA